MPRRVRHAKRRRLELTLQVYNVLTLGPSLRDERLDDRLLAEVWHQHRERLLTHGLPGSRPWGFFAFEPGVPVELRAGPDDDEDRGLDDARLRWLVATGRVADDELAAVVSRVFDQVAYWRDVVDRLERDCGPDFDPHGYRYQLGGATATADALRDGLRDAGIDPAKLPKLSTTDDGNVGRFGSPDETR